MREKRRTNINYEKFKNDLYRYYFERYAQVLLEFNFESKNLSFKEFLTEICELPYMGNNRER